MANNAVPPAWVFNLHDASLGISRTLARGIHARVFAGQHVMVSVVHVAPHSVGTMHSHPEEQWGILVNGECTRLQGDAAIPMHAGDFWRTPGGVPHAIRTGATRAVVVDIFSPPRHDYTQSGDGVGQAQVSADTADDAQG